MCQSRKEAHDKFDSVLMISRRPHGGENLLY